MINVIVLLVKFVGVVLVMWGGVGGGVVLGEFEGSWGVVYE